ncbi:SUN domain-containing protein 1 isoform X2 [Lethenteron reissneri]|uniref:SUN domain-containing protein 1 isoform X2 n=1 Tax=Lethenteron reissneri TaxID=7753 RepID=UPI002AB6188A|nr:SUN domain-containing protein 1 isoform X2 [Lethenteron reissneri]XP_061416485.1 SUN domain-containing protein 1 isoform X2 [Lethenteron reissneri]XP_061416486.1 SUN domain-containing protein 1 isoform X2 [Lethenteron reissneri]
MSRRSSRLATNGYYQEEHSYHEGDGGGSSGSGGGGSGTASPGSVRYRENVARSLEDERVFRARKTSHRGSGATPHGARGRAHVDSPLVTTERGNSIRVERGDGLSLTSTLIEESCLPERECSGYLWGLDKEEDQSTITLMMSEQTGHISNESQRSLHHNTSTSAAAAAATDGHATRLWNKHSGDQHRTSPAQHHSKTTRKASTSANFFRRLVLKCMWVFGVGWYNLIGLLSLFNVFLLTRRIPRAIKMILLLILLLLAIVGVGYALVVFGYVHLSRSHEHAQAVPSDVMISSGMPSVVQVQSQRRLQQLEQQVSSLRGVVEQQELQLEQLRTAAEQHEKQGHALEGLRNAAEKQERTICDLKKLAEGHEHKRLASSVEVLEENVSKLKHEILHGHLQKVEAAVVATLGALASRGDDRSELALFAAWLTAHVLSSDHMRTLLRETEQAVVANVSKRWTWPPDPERDGALESTGGGVSRQEVYAIVQNALRLYEEDKIGKFDFALESAGGTVISVRCSEAYSQQIALITLFGVPLWYTSQSPRVIIQPDVYPGDCWAFKGSRGYVAIKLSDTIYPSDFTLEHIPRALSPTGDITSAPKDFAVYGLDEEIQQEGYLLGQYMYDKHGDPLQMFHMSNSTAAHPFGIVELRILSNWGNSEYTCIYRFRVHGELATSRG